MHYKLLMAIKVPKDRDAVPAKNVANAVALSTVRMLPDTGTDGTQTQKHDSFAKNLMGTSDFQTIAESMADAMLEPYCLDTNNPEYLSFLDATDDGLKDYENGHVDFVKMPDGRILETDDYDFSRRYELYNGLVYRRRFGKLHHRKRNKKASQIRVMPSRTYKELYPTFDDFMRQRKRAEYDEVTGRYGEYYNPNGMWDWYKIGGLWPFPFFTKHGLDMIIPSKSCYSDGGAPETKIPDDYQWVVGAKKANIAWDVMLNVYRKEQKEQFKRYEQWISEGTIPQEYGRDYRIFGDNVVFWGDTVFRRGETEEGYLSRIGLGPECQYPITAAAILDAEGLHSIYDTEMKGYDEDDNIKQAWCKKVNDFIEKQSDDTVLLIIDCHM